MRRTTATIIVLLLIGAMCNLALAWTIAWSESAAPAGRILSDLIGWSTGDNHLSGGVWRIPGATNLQMTCYPQNVNSGQQRGTFPQFINGLPAWQRSELLAWWGNTDSPKPSFASIEVFASGWPLVSFYVVEERNGKGGSVVRGGWTKSSGVPRGETKFPWLPIWRGIVINSALYAAIAWVFMLISRALWQWNRYRRGACPKCAYDLRGNFAAGCTECGWRRDAVAS